MRPRRARREELRAIDEEAAREASAYVHRAMSFSGVGRRLTIVTSPVIARTDEPSAPESRVVASEVAQTTRTDPLPAIPAGLPEGATLAPMSGSREIVVPLRAPVPTIVVTPTPPMTPTDARNEPRMADPDSRASARNAFPIAFGLGALVVEALLARRHRRRTAPRS